MAVFSKKDPYNLLTTYLDTSDLTVKHEKNISQTRAVGGRRPAIGNEIVDTVVFEII